MSGILSIPTSPASAPGGSGAVAIPAPGSGTQGPPGTTGAPGGNITAIGLFTAASGLSIPIGTTRVNTSGHSSTGVGSAWYSYDATINSAYVSAHPHTSFLSADGRGWGLATDQTLNWFMFGIVDDDRSGTGTDQQAIIAEMIAWQRARIISGSLVHQYGNGGFKPIFCYGAVYTAARFYADFAAQFKGFTIGVPGSSPTQIRFPANTAGVYFDQNSDGYLFEGFTIVGGFDKTSAGSAGDEGEYHGLEWHAKGVRRNLQFYYWQGDALHDFSDAAGGTGNSNGDVEDTIFVYGCRNACNRGGGDVNAKEIRCIVAVVCRQAGFYEHSFLGNHYHGFDLEANGYLPGWVNVGTTAARPTVYAWYNGAVWTPINGRETQCSTNAPPAYTVFTDANWIRADNWGTAGSVAEATAHVFGIPTWVSGLYFRVGGGIIHQGLANQSTFIGYAESDQINQFDGPVAKICGQIGNAWTTSRTYGLFFGKANVELGNQRSGDYQIGGDFAALGNSVNFGTTDGSGDHGAGNFLAKFRSPGSISSIQWLTSGATLQAFMIAGGGAMALYGSSKITLGTTAGDRYQADDTAFQPLTDNNRTLGAASLRWSTVYAGTGTINTSDKRLKSELEIDDALLDAWSNIKYVSYQWKDAIDAKGEKKARIHFGVFAQDVEKLFKDHGIDVRRYAFFCHDEWKDVFEPEWVEKEIETHVPVTHPALPSRASSMSKELPRKMKKEPLWRTQQRQAHKDTKPRQIETEKSIVREIVLDKHGKPKMKKVQSAGDRFGIRYDQIAIIEAMWQRRRGDRLEARIAALEASEC